MLCRHDSQSDVLTKILVVTLLNAREATTRLLEVCFTFKSLVSIEMFVDESGMSDSSEVEEEIAVAICAEKEKREHRDTGYTIPIKKQDKFGKFRRLWKEFATDEERFHVYFPLYTALVNLQKKTDDFVASLTCNA